MTYLIITIRIVTIMFLLLVLVLKTGRRKIGELPVFDFLTLIILGSVVGADIADPDIKHLPTAYAVILLVFLQYLISCFIIKSRKIGGLVTFGPTVIISKGKFIPTNMKRLKYSIENVMMYLREKDIFDISEVDYAIVEDSGNISVLKKTQNLPLTPQHMHIETKSKGIPLPLVVEGKVYEKNLGSINKDKKWLLVKLKENNINDINDAFYVSVDSEGKLYMSKVVEENAGSGLSNLVI